MAKDISYELFPGVRVSDARDVEYNNGKRLDTSKFKQFDREWHANGWSDQEVRDKVGRNRGWAVCRSWTDVSHKQMCFDVMVNAKTSEVKAVSFDDVCMDFGWKSFEHSDDGQMIFPEK